MEVDCYNKDNIMDDGNESITICSVDNFNLTLLRGTVCDAIDCEFVQNKDKQALVNGSNFDTISMFLCKLENNNNEESAAKTEVKNDFCTLLGTITLSVTRHFTSHSGPHSSSRSIEKVLAKNKGASAERN